MTDDELTISFEEVAESSDETYPDAFVIPVADRGPHVDSVECATCEKPIIVGGDDYKDPLISYHLHNLLAHNMDQEESIKHCEAADQ